LAGIRSVFNAIVNPYKLLKDLSILNTRQGMHVSITFIPFKSRETIPLILQNRGAKHRLAAYRVWQSLGFYTLTIDYR
jgi:hypothetical protein